MGLAERRALKEFQDKRFPELKKHIDDAAGFEMPLDVQWDTLAVEGHGADYLNDWYFTQVFFLPLAGALKKITMDDLGKEALKAKLKRIVIRYDAASAPASNFANGLSFEKGVLSINFEPGVNAGDEDSAFHKERVEAIVDLLESKL